MDHCGDDGSSVGGMAIISAGVLSEEIIIHRNGISVNNAPNIRMTYFNTAAIILNIFLFLLIYASYFFFPIILCTTVRTRIIRNNITAAADARP